MDRLPPRSSSRRRALVGQALAFAPARLDWAGGLRAAIAATLPSLLAPIVGRPELLWTSLAGFNTVLVDKGGSYRTRALAMGAYGLAGAVAVGVGGLLAPYPLMAVPLALVVITACGYVRALSAEAASVGTCTAATVLVAIALPAPNAAVALERALFALGGSALSMSFTLGLWPLRPFRPARYQTARVLEQLAVLARGLDHLGDSTRADAASERAVALRATREAIEAARRSLGTLRRGRPGTSRRGELLILVVETADRLLGTLAALTDLMTEADAGSALRARVTADGETLAAHLVAIADALRRERPIVLPSAAWRVDGASAGGHADVARLARAARDGLAELVEAALGIDGTASSKTASAAATPFVTRQPARAILAANFTLRSAVLRHALRLGISTSFVVLVTQLFHLGHGYWASITALVVLQPHGSETITKALQRVTGTLLGAGIAIVAATLVHDTHALIAIIFVFTTLSVALLPRNYGAFAVFLTPTFILLARLSGGDLDLAGVRVFDTLIGAGVALAGATLLFPLAAHDQFRPLLADAFVALAELCNVAGNEASSTTAEQRHALQTARRKVGLSLANAEAAFARLLTEAAPAPDESATLSTLLLYGHRIAAALIALATNDAAATRTERAARAPELTAELVALAAAIESDAAPATRPPQPSDADEITAAQQSGCERVASLLAVERAALARWAGMRAP